MKRSTIHACHETEPGISVKFVRPGCRAGKGTDTISDRPSLLTKEHLIADFLYLQENLGRRPKLAEFTCHCHSPKVLDRVFGRPCWRRFIKAVGKQAMPENILSAEHLIQDYLDTAEAVKREPSYSHFHDRHRHSLKVLVRVFGNPGWTNLRKAALKKRKKGMITNGLSAAEEAAVRTMNEARPARAEREILKEIRSTYRALLSANRAGKRKTASHKAQKNVWKLRKRLNDLFYESGRVVSVEEALSRPRY